MATRTIANAGGNWNATATWVEAAVPTASDDVVATATSGNLTINVASVCRSIDLTNYVGTLTHNAFTLTIGTSTAQASLVALSFPTSGWTYTLANASTSALTFTSTVASTIQTVDFGGKTVGSLSFVAATTSGYKLLNNGFTAGTAASVAPTQGTFNTNNINFTAGQFVSGGTNVRTFTFGSSTMTVTATNSWNVISSTALTVTTNTATVIQTGANSSFTGPTNWNGLSVIMNGSGTATINTIATLVNLSRIGTAVRTDSLVISAAITVTGTLTLTGNSILNRLAVISSVGGTGRTITVNGTLAISNVDFNDMVGAGSVSWDLSAISGGSGDMGGNSGIIFTTAVQQTWATNTGGSWSLNAWTTRVPLPQDNVVFGSRFGGTPTISTDMPRLGKNIDWTQSTGSLPTWNVNVQNCVSYGSLALRSGMTIFGGFTYQLAGRSVHTITTNDVVLGTVQVGGPGSTYTFVDNANFSGAFTIVSGTISFNGNVTLANIWFISNNTTTRVINMGSGTWNFTTTASLSIINNTATSSLTINPGTAVIVISGVTANIRTIVGGGYTYPLVVYTVPGSIGPLVITGSNTFTGLNIAGGRTLTLTRSTITNISRASGWQVVGTTANPVTISSDLAGTQATLSCPSGTINSDYISLKDSAATGGATWYAGANSTNVSNNNGWLFTAGVGLEYWGATI